MEKKRQYFKINNYSMKCRLYPNKAQREKIDTILHGLRVAHNVTMYEMKHHNPAITREKDGVFWPDFRKMAGKKWLDWLRENYPVVNEVPAASLSTNNGLFLKDVKKSHEKKGKLPVDKWDIQYYSARKPRRSFLFQQNASSIVFFEDRKVLSINVPKCGRINIRGWNNKLFFDEDLQSTFKDYCSKNPKKALTVQISKDNCDKYWCIITLENVYKPVGVSLNREPLGVDVGIKEIAILSTGDTFTNKRFKNGEKKNGDHIGPVQRHRRHLNRRMSRRWGWSNEKFREAYKKDSTIKPSVSYLNTVKKLARLERKISDRRRSWNDEITTEIVSRASFIGIETLSVKNMFRNKHLSNALSDAAMGDILQRLKYKSEWYGVPIQAIDRWTPSSKRCSSCGYIKSDLTLSIRAWKCPCCGAEHDRDVNAAINILKYAMEAAKEAAV